MYFKIKYLKKVSDALLDLSQTNLDTSDTKVVDAVIPVQKSLFQFIRTLSTGGSF